MSEFKQYKHTQIAEARPYKDGDEFAHYLSVPLGMTPKVGDMIVRNPKKHGQQWLVTKKFFEANFVPLYKVNGHVFIKEEAGGN